MHARQRAQLTGTNRPIGLIRSSDGQGTRARRPRTGKHARPQNSVQRPDADNALMQDPWALRRRKARGSKGELIRSGGHRCRDTPDPIPNSAVKRGPADGTATQVAGE